MLSYPYARLPVSHSVSQRVRSSSDKSYFLHPLLRVRRMDEWIVYTRGVQTAKSRRHVGLYRTINQKALYGCKRKGTRGRVRGLRTPFPALSTVVVLVAAPGVLSATLRVITDKFLPLTHSPRLLSNSVFLIITHPSPPPFIEICFLYYQHPISILESSVFYCNPFYSFLFVSFYSENNRTVSCRRKLIRPNVTPNSSYAWILRKL